MLTDDFSTTSFNAVFVVKLKTVVLSNVIILFANPVNKAFVSLLLPDIVLAVVIKLLILLQISYNDTSLLSSNSFIGSLTISSSVIPNLLATNKSAVVDKLGFAWTTSATTVVKGDITKTVDPVFAIAFNVNLFGYYRIL